MKRRVGELDEHRKTHGAWHRTFDVDFMLVFSV